MVKVCRFGGQKEIKLENARFTGTRFRLTNIKKICHQDTHPFALHKAIMYDEYLADGKAVTKLNALLAELSGRRIEEFEGKTDMDPFIKR
ncbi:hypothetical protein [Desulfomonile tiedjei]|nr:hypothetical protein [Desulfomonile tiedjei]